MKEIDNETKILIMLIVFVIIGMVLAMIFKEKLFLLGTQLACFISQITISLNNMN